MINSDAFTHYANLPTEQSNPATENLDEHSTLGLLHAINQEDQTVAVAVGNALPQIVAVVEAVVEAFNQDGRLFYVGAGTSGRLGVLDASECPPTFSVPPTLVQGIIAGGEVALRHAVEGAEDDATAGREAIITANVGVNDVVIGLSASGGAAFVVAAMQEAERRGAKTACITCVETSVLATTVGLPVVVLVGAEVLTGSSRLKAGTAQKLVLNMISTASMVRWGKTYGNRMVDVKPTNQKLQARAVRLVAEIADVSVERATEALGLAGGNVKISIIMLQKNLQFQESIDHLKNCRNTLKIALNTPFGEFGQSTSSPE
jgi:N-acetylmuramic acid 6-phosphate etherase